jgi:thioredoxin 1
MSENVAELTADNFDDALSASAGTPMLVDFWAEWCGPCKAIAPILDEIAGEQEGKVTIAKINVDDHQSIGMRYQVMSLPTMLLFENGEITKRITGGKSKSQILEEIGL